MSRDRLGAWLDWDRGAAAAAAAALALAAVTGVYAGLHLRTWVRFVGPGWDEAWQLPLAFLRSEPGLYAKDDLLAAMGRWYPPGWTALLSRLLALSGGDFLALMGGGSAVLLAVFAAGNFLLAKRLSGSAFAALVMAVVLLRPRQAPFNPYGVMVGNFTANNVGIALSPWFLWHFLKPGRGAAGWALLGLSLGLACLINPSVCFHLCLLFGVVLLLEGDWKAALALGLPFLPFLFASSSLLARGPADPPDLAVTAFRNGYLLAPWSALRALPDSLLLPLLLSCVLPAAFWLSPEPDRTRLRRLAEAALVFGASATLARFIPRWTLAISWRSLFLLFPVFYAAGAVVLAESLRARRAGAAAAALALWAAALLVTDLGYFRGRAAPEPGLPAETALAACKAEFLEVSDWARMHTAPGDLFLVPPDSFAAFRLYARRGAAVTNKEGTGFYQGSLARLWKERYDRARAAYDAGTTYALRAEAARAAADWIVAPATTGGEPVFSNRCYEVLRP